MCTLWRCKYTPTRKEKLLWMTSHTVGQPLYEVSQCHGSVIWRFHLIVHNVSGGEFFTGNYINWHPPHSGTIFDPQAISACCTFVYKIWIWRVPKSSKNDDPVPMTFKLKINRLRQCRGLLLCQFSSHFDQRFSFYRANIHTHTHTHTHHDKVIAISVSWYYVVGAETETQCSD